MDEKTQILVYGYAFLPVYDVLHWIQTQMMEVGKMLDILKKVDLKNSSIFAAGVLFGTAGIKILSSKDAKKVYTNVTAVALRAKECVMNVSTTIQENAEDILEEAKQINEDRLAEEEQEDMEASE